MKALVYDTETTGLPLFKQPSEDPAQPHIVELAALLVDLDSGKTLDEFHTIIKPDGWVIPDEVAAIHGITTEKATEFGIDEATAVEKFMSLQTHAGVRIAHNQQFDERILRIALKRFFDEQLAEFWKAAPSECTAILSTPLCMLPPTAKMLAAKRTHYKTPNLTEAYRHFTGKELVGAHSAMNDVLACRDVYFAIKGIKNDQEPQN